VSAFVSGSRVEIKSRQNVLGIQYLLIWQNWLVEISQLQALPLLFELSNLLLSLFVFSQGPKRIVPAYLQLESQIVLTQSGTRDKKHTLDI
jgi:hypothetical protein